jgi:hypothetical protein
MKKLVIVAILCGIISIQSGCVSYLAYKQGKDTVYKERVALSGDERAISIIDRGGSPETAMKVVMLDDKTVGIGMDIGLADVWAKQPIKQTLAALADGIIAVGCAYGGYQLVNSGNSNDGDDSEIVGGDQVIINGDGNDVDVGTTETLSQTY